MTVELKNSVFVIFGSRGSGKSALGWAFFSRAILAGARKHLIVVEPSPYFYEGFGICSGLKEAEFASIEISESDIAQDPENALSKDFWAAVIEKSPHAVFTLKDMREKVREHMGIVLAEAIHQVGDAFVLWDELPAFISEISRDHEGIPRLLNEGRKRGIDLILISQFRTWSHPLLGKIAATAYGAETFVFAYQVRDSNELRLLRPIFGDRAEELRELKPLEFLVALPDGKVERSSNPAVFKDLFGVETLGTPKAQSLDELIAIREAQASSSQAQAPSSQASSSQASSSQAQASSSQASSSQAQASSSQAQAPSSQASSSKLSKLEERLEKLEAMLQAQALQASQAQAPSSQAIVTQAQGQAPSASSQAQAPQGPQAVAQVKHLVPQRDEQGVVCFVSSKGKILYIHDRGPSSKLRYILKGDPIGALKELPEGYQAIEGKTSAYLAKIK